MGNIGTLCLVLGIYFALSGAWCLGYTEFGPPDTLKNTIFYSLTGPAIFLVGLVIVGAFIVMGFLPVFIIRLIAWSRNRRKKKVKTAPK